MRVCFFRLFGAAALAAIISLHSVAQEYSNGGKGASGRGPAILTPVEAYGVHSPGLAPADAKRWKPYIPYYAPLSPVASSTRWKPWSYHPLLPYYTSYYPGYSPHRLFNPPPRPYGNNGWGAGPGPEMPLPEDPETTPLEYAEYTTVIDDDTTFWNMGGNGLVPYGDPQADTGRAADLVDAIQASRARGRGHVLRAAPQRPATEATQQQQGNGGRPSRRGSTQAEPIPPGEASPEQDDDAGPDNSSGPKNSTNPMRSVER